MTTPSPPPQAAKPAAVAHPKITLSSQLKNFAIGGASGMIATCCVSVQLIEGGVADSLTHSNTIKLQES